MAQGRRIYLGSTWILLTKLFLQKGCRKRTNLVRLNSVLKKKHLASVSSPIRSASPVNLIKFAFTGNKIRGTKSGTRNFQHTICLGKSDLAGWIVKRNSNWNRLVSRVEISHRSFQPFAKAAKLWYSVTGGSEWTERINFVQQKVKIFPWQTQSTLMALVHKELDWKIWLIQACRMSSSSGYWCLLKVTCVSGCCLIVHNLVTIRITD